MVYFIVVVFIWRVEGGLYKKEKKFQKKTQKKTSIKNNWIGYIIIYAGKKCAFCVTRAAADAADGVTACVLSI